eukprot:TRINITY_DN44691_c0_g1_i1.p3 TRINITY_DN44691_c0_g1~~TRINITY_DN44691_c0_g1_i1.p3  ORF type:complete len:116 (-),score=10.01 TRINITY_DN44691_c0_g1_i1:176-523(-)
MTAQDEVAGHPSRWRDSMHVNVGLPEQAKGPGHLTIRDDLLRCMGLNLYNGKYVTFDTAAVMEILLGRADVTDLLEARRVMPETRSESDLRQYFDIGKGEFLRLMFNEYVNNSAR